MFVVLFVVGFVVNFWWLIWRRWLSWSLPVWGGGAAARATPRMSGSAANTPRWWPGLISSTPGYSPTTIAEPTATIHQSKSLELVQSQYRAPAFTQLIGGISAKDRPAVTSIGPRRSNRQASDLYREETLAASAPKSPSLGPLYLPHRKIPLFDTPKNKGNLPDRKL